MKTAAREAMEANDLLIESVVGLDEVLGDLEGSASGAAREMNDLRTAIGETALADSRLVSEMKDLRTAVGENTLAVSTLAGRVNDLRDSFITAAFAAAALGKAEDGAGARAVTAGSRLRLLGTGIRLSGNAIHWLISGFFELAAVVIPATIAAGAWAAAWIQGTANVYEHLMAVYGATEADNKMFHETAGQAVGLGNALQKAQDSANANVYQALGSAVLIVKEHFTGLAQVGVQVGRIFDNFAAKLVYDFSAAGGAGAKLTGVLSHMVPDLVGIGQIFGNLGHALLNFASDMPGLAEVLLGIVDGITRVILWISKLPHYVILGAMAFEEFIRWGGLLVTILGKVGFATTELTGGFFSLERAGGVFMNLFRALPLLVAGGIQKLGEFMMTIGRFDGKINAAGQAVMTFGQDLEEGIGGLSIGAALGITAIVAAMGFLIYKAVTAKTALQNFVASLQSGIQKASNAQVMGLLAADMGKMQGAADQAGNSVRRLNGDLAAGHVAGQYSTNLRSLHSALVMDTQTLHTATAAQQQMQHQMANVATGAAYLANTYHTTLAGGMALATTAGVKLIHNITGTGEAAAIARLKVASLVQGYESMGTPLGVVGKDMTALAIQSGLAGTKVSALNSAWDDFMSNLTAGTGGLSSFETSLKNMGSGIAHVTDNLGVGTQKFSADTQQFAKDLTHYTGQGAQAWQNFGQVVGSTAPQVIDFLRTAGAEGAISGKQFTQATRDMVAQLLPLASHSKTATSQLSGLAQEAGGPATDNFKKLKDWTDQSNTSTKNLGQIIGDATQKMGNMAQVAQNLGNVLNNDITQAMAAAEFKTSGVANAMVTYTQDLRNGTQATAAGRSDRAQLIHDLELTGQSAANARRLVALLAGQILGLHGKTVTIGVDTNYYTTGAGKSGLGFPGSGPGGHGGPVPKGGPLAGAVIHIHGSVLTEQGVVRSLQAGSLRKTLRNGSTQDFIAGRRH